MALSSCTPLRASAPASDAPVYDAPVHGVPAVDAPVYDAPAHEAPACDALASVAAAQHAPAPGPSLECHFHVPPHGRDVRHLDRTALAYQVDARLALRARIRVRLERARAAVARALLESKAADRAGYSNPRDYAREELGLSLRALQEMAQLDRLLVKFPRFDSAVSSGVMAPSRALAVAPVLTPESERNWYRRARTRTVHQLRKLVAEERERAASRLVSRDAPSMPEDTEEDACIEQRSPLRSRMLWEAFVEESSRAAGTPVSHGQALEILLAEFWPLVPSSLAARLRGQAKLAPLPSEDEDDKDDGSGFVHRAAPAVPSGSSSACAPLSCPVPPQQYQTLRQARTAWRRRLMETLEGDPDHRRRLRDLDRRALKHAERLLSKGIPTGLPPEDEAFLDRACLQGMDVRGLERRFHAIRARLRRLAVDEGALLWLVRGFHLYRALHYAGFGHYTRDRLGLGRRAAEEHADTHRMLWHEPFVKEAWMRGALSDSHLPLLRRLIRGGIRGRALIPWAVRANQVPVSTFRDQVRYIEAAQAGFWKSRCPSFALLPVQPPSPEEWCRIRTEMNHRPDYLLWVAHGCEFAGEGARDRTIAGHGDGSASREQGRHGGKSVADFRAGRGPEVRAVLAPHRDVGDVPDSPAHAEPQFAGMAAPAPDPAAGNPLYPSLLEPVTCTCRLYGPVDLLESYLDAVEAVRAVHGSDRPAWWCLEIMILHVRRDWAAQSAYARRNSEHYDIYARDGFRCTAPGCTSRRNLHAHHLDFASNGGPDDPWNLTTLCAACHEYMIHQALLVRATGRAPHAIQWKLGTELTEDGRIRPRRVYLGEFRVI